MNPFSAVSWIWKALRGHSVTFAALFAFALLGVSVLGWFKTGLAAMGVNWLGLLLIPMIAVGVLARKEREWIRDEQTRKRWSRWLVGGSIAVAIGLALLIPKKAAAPNRASDRNSTAESDVTRAPVRPRGPSGK